MNPTLVIIRCMIQLKFINVVVLLYRCMLHNFAGNIEMYGILDSIASGPVEARLSEKSTMASF